MEPILIGLLVMLALGAHAISLHERAPEIKFEAIAHQPVYAGTPEVEELRRQYHKYLTHALEREAMAARANTRTSRESYEFFAQRSWARADEVERALTLHGCAPVCPL